MRYAYDSGRAVVRVRGAWQCAAMRDMAGGGVWWRVVVLCPANSQLVVLVLVLGVLVVAPAPFSQARRAAGPARMPRFFAAWCALPSNKPRATRSHKVCIASGCIELLGAASYWRST
jgi:hypothetical protein